MTAALVVSGVLLILLGVLPAIRSTGVLPVWRIRRAPVLSPQHEAERARILATPVEELAEEIARERERAQPGGSEIRAGAHVTKPFTHFRVHRLGDKLGAREFVGGREYVITQLCTKVGARFYTRLEEADICARILAEYRRQRAEEIS